MMVERAWCRVALVALALCIVPVWRLDADGFDWGLVKVGALDYVPVSRIAEFYALESEPLGVSGAEAESLVQLAGERARIEASVDSRQVIINGVKHWLGYPVIEQDGGALISRIDFVKTLEPTVRPERVGELADVDTVILDAGHGGADRGAVQGDVFEKDLNLDVCRKAKPLLEQKGFEVVMTRDSDVFVPLAERARIANRHPNAIFISIHFNYSPNGAEANGLEVFAMSPRGTPSTGEQAIRASHLDFHPGNGWDAESLVLANCVQHAALGVMPQFDRGVKRARFAVLRLTRMPAILVEGAFLSNTADISKAECETWRATLASSILAAVVDYRQLAKGSQPPKQIADYSEPPATAVALSMPGFDGMQPTLQVTPAN